jgi:predicted kinase
VNKLKLIFVGGSLATGKSTISKHISDTLKIQRVSLDEIKESIFDIGGYRDRLWSKEIGRLSFPVFRDLINLHLSCGESVVADATFLWPSDIEWLHSFSQKYEADLIQIWLTADPKVARERFLQRSNSSRHPGHNDSVESVIAEFDNRFFNKTFVPLPIIGKTKIVDTTSFDAIDHDEILRWI